MENKENNNLIFKGQHGFNFLVCIKNGKPRLDHPNFPFSIFHFQLISGSNRHRKSVLNRNRHQTHNRGNRHICANVSFPILHQ